MTTKKSLWKRILAAALSLTLSAGMFGGTAVSAQTADDQQQTMIDSFVNPGEDVDAKPMVRFWFPDAGAGLTTEELQALKNDPNVEEIAFGQEYLSMVTNYITSLYDAGFGGVELTMLADGSNYGSTLVGKIGWGTKAWTRVLCEALNTANHLGKGDGTDFKIDITMTAHWPLVIDNVDPNDDEQQQQLTYATQAVTAEELADGGKITLDLPTQKTADNKSGTFLFVDKFIGATFAKASQKEVTSQNPWGGGTTTTVKTVVDFDSLTEIPAVKKTDASSANGYAGYAGGVPSSDYIIQYEGVWYDGADLPSGVTGAIGPNGGEGYYTHTDKDGNYYLLVKDGAAFTEDVTVVREVTYSQTPFGKQERITIKVLDAEGTDIANTLTIYYDKNPVFVAHNENGGVEYCAANAVSGRDSFGIVTEEEAAADPSLTATERQYMDDWQYLYEVDAADVQAAMEAAGELAEGEQYVLIPVYRQGCGQVTSGGETIVMPHRTYVIDYYNEKGVQKVIDHWENNMLDIPVTVTTGETVTLREMLQANAGSSIFEDSLEMNTSGTAWSAYFIDPDNQAGDNAGYEGDFERYMGYEAAKYLPILAGMGSDNSEMDAKLNADLGTLKDELFNAEHSATVSDWAHSFGGGYRFQSSGDLSQSLNIDVVEADNGTLSQDGIQTAASTVNLRGDQYLSMEAITSTTPDPDFYQTMLELNMCFSGGINRVVLHGTAFSQSLNGYQNVWPGWAFCNVALGKGYGCWDNRQLYWDDVHLFSDYVTRVQGLLQQGAVKVPVMIVGSGGDWSALRDSGYHYNITIEDVLMMDEASPDRIRDGVLNPDGLAMDTIVLNNQSTVSNAAFLERLTEYAEKGVNVVLFGNTEYTSISGMQYGDLDPETTSIPENKTDAAVQEAFEKLESTPNVCRIADTAELVSFLDEHCDNTIRYDEDGLEATHLRDKADGTDYYFLLNYRYDGSSIRYGEVGEALDLSKTTGLDMTATVNVGFEPGDSLYRLDSYTGEITELQNFVDNGDGTVTVQLDIAAWDTTVLAVSSNQEAFAEAGAVKEMNTVENSVIDLTDADWNLTVDSYGPATDFDEDAAFQAHASKTIDVGTVKLGLWKDIIKLSEQEYMDLGITAEKLASEKVNDTLENGSQYISGIGFYTTNFSLDKATDKAVFRFEHRNTEKQNDAQVCQDMVTRVTVRNADGEEVFSTGAVNALSDEVELGALAAGDYTIEVKLVSTLRNREWIEGSAVHWRTYYLGSYGLTAASIATYDAQVTASAPESARVNENFVVAVTASSNIDDVRLYNAYDMSIGRKDVQVADNGNGTNTWYLTVSLGTVGKGRELKVVTRGEEGYYCDSGVRVSLDITSIPPAIEQFDLPETAVANRSFTFTAITDTTAAKVEVYNEYGMKMGMIGLSYRDVDGQRIWSGTMKIGTRGARTFTAYAKNVHGILSETGVSASVTVVPFAAV